MRRAPLADSASTRRPGDHWRTQLRRQRAILRQYSDRIFRERQLPLRTDGRVHYVFLTPRLQQTVAGLLACAALVAFIMGARLIYQSFLVDRGEVRIAELQAENVEMATALASTAALRKTEERVAASVRSLGETLRGDVQRLSETLRRSRLEPSDILPRELAAIAQPSVRPAAIQGHAAYAKNLREFEQTLTAWTAFRTVIEAIPLANPLDDGRLTSPFGVRKHPVTGRRSFHRGIDIATVRRTPVYAPAPGVVTFVGTKGSFGKFVEVDHGRGFKSRYGHLDKILVRRGQKIDFRQKLALVGSTGRSTGPHLHYEVVFRGRQLDPEDIFEAGHNLLRR